MMLDSSVGKEGRKTSERQKKDLVSYVFLIADIPSACDYEKKKCTLLASCILHIIENYIIKPCSY